jgi:hypothetical protein
VKKIAAVKNINFINICWKKLAKSKQINPYLAKVYNMVGC